MAGIPDSFEDAVLGPVVFDRESKEWRFTVPIRGREVRGTIFPHDYRRPIAEPALAEIRECVGWVRDNEPSIRDYITGRMFDNWMSGWYDEETDVVNTPEGFREAIYLPGFFVYEKERAATLCYDDGGLFGGHGIMLTVASGGRYTQPPQIVG